MPQGLCLDRYNIFDALRIELNIDAQVMQQWRERGQLLVMLCLSVYYVAGLSLFGLSVAWPIDILTGLAVFVPYVGFGVGLLLAALSGFLEMAPMQAGLMLLVVFGIG